MARIRTDNVFGTVSDNPLTAAATTLNSNGLANLAAVAAPDQAIVVLDPNRVAGAPEIVIVTAHMAAATSATITRGQFGTVAREHAAGTEWVHAPIANDFALGILGYSQVTTFQTGITSEVDVAGLDATVNVGIGRRIKITGSVFADNDTVDSGLVLRIRESTTTLQARSARFPVANEQQDMSVIVVLTPSAGSHEYRLTAAQAGGGTARIVSAAGQPGFILVEDIGPA